MKRGQRVKENKKNYRGRIMRGKDSVLKENKSKNRKEVTSNIEDCLATLIYLSN